MLSQSDFNRYQHVCLNALQNVDLLTDWDLQFIRGFAEKLTTYKRHTFVSGNQDDQFERIEKYLRQELGNDYDD